jgi:molybdate transport system substrate-binding protein
MYARGRLALWTRADVPLPASLQGLDPARKLAIANPDHAPYGRAARTALQHAGIWPALEKNVVYGENVQQTLQYARSGNADAAIVALSLVSGSDEGHSMILEGAAVDQALVVCNRGKNRDGGQRFADFVTGPQGREALKRFGFLAPGQG